MTGSQAGVGEITDAKMKAYDQARREGATIAEAIAIAAKAK